MDRYPNYWCCTEIFPIKYFKYDVIFLNIYWPKNLEISNVWKNMLCHWSIHTCMLRRDNFEFKCCNLISETVKIWIHFFYCAVWQSSEYICAGFLLNCVVSMLTRVRVTGRILVGLYYWTHKSWLMRMTTRTTDDKLITATLFPLGLLVHENV